MSNYDKYEEEINILTLLWFVLSKWRSILIVAIIGLVLGVGYAVVSAPSGGEAPLTTESIDQEVEDTAGIVAEQAYETTLAKVESLENYIAEATIMEMNPYELYRGTITYVIDDVYKDLAGLNTAIYSYVWDGALMEELEKVGPYTVKELDCLLGLSQEISSQTVANEDAIGQVTAKISICAQNENEVQKLLEQIDFSVRGYLDTLLNKQDIYGYKILTMNLKETTSMTIADYQMNIRGKYDAEKANLDTYKSNLELMSTEDVKEDSTFDKMSIFKYGIVGFVGGLVLMIFAWIIRYLVCGRLFVVNNKEGRFKVKQLGTIRDLSRLRGIDRWIAYKFYGIYSTLSMDEQKNITLLNIKNAIEEIHNPQKILLTSNGKGTLKIVEFLKLELEAMGYTVELCDGVGRSSDNLKMIALCDVAIVLGDELTTKVALFEEEINILKKYVKNVLGMVLISNKS